MENITPPGRDRALRLAAEREQMRGADARAARLTEALRRHPAGSGLVPGVDVQDVPPWTLEPGAERFGGEPPVGTVLRWDDERDGVQVVRHGDRGWSATGDDRGALPWEVIACMIGNQPCDVAVGWREIPTPAPEPSGDDAVRDWAARFLPESASSVTPLEPDGAGGHRRVPSPPPFTDERSADALDPDGAHRDASRVEREREAGFWPPRVDDATTAAVPTGDVRGEYCDGAATVPRNGPADYISDGPHTLRPHPDRTEAVGPEQGPYTGAGENGVEADQDDR